MTRRVIILISALVLMLVLAVGCSSDTTETGSTENADNDEKTLVIGVDDQFPPMGYRDEEGNIIGFDIDLATKVAEKLGMDLKVQQIDWSAKEMELSQGNVDAVWNGLTITPEREEQMLFTDPYLENDQVIVVKKDSAINAKSDLAGKKVGLQKASSAEDALNADAIAKEVGEVVSYDENVSALQDLGIGRTDAVVVDSVVANWYIKENSSDYRILSESLAPEQYGVAVAKENEELQKKINDALKEVKEDGTGAEVSEKWFGSDILYKG